jgi:hypothetical protein
VPDWHFDLKQGQKALQDQMGTTTLTGFGADNLSASSVRPVHYCDTLKTHKAVV